MLSPLKICLLLSTALVPCFGFAAFASDDDALEARVEVNQRLGHDRSITETEFWLPIVQSGGAVLYGDLRLVGDNQNNREGNLGIGYRKIVSEIDGVVGVHAWFDRRKTARGSTFNQATIGGEYLGNTLDVLVNGYIPLSSERRIEVPNTNPQGPALAGTGIVVDTNGEVLEEGQHGFDLELGLQVPFLKDHTDSTRLYAGGFYFDGPNTESISGWRTRFVSDVTQNIQIGARFQRDDVRGSQGFLEASLRFPFDNKKSYREEGLRARLDESPERDIDIVTGEAVTDTGDRVQVLNTQTGTAQEVLHVNNQAADGGDGSVDNPFNTLTDAQGAASAQTIIYVNAGDGTSTNQDQGITLDKQGQQLIGSGVDFVYDSGRFSTANGASPTSIVIAPAGAAPVIGNVNAGQDGVTVSANDIMVAGVTVDNAGTGRDGIVVRADGAAASAQNVTIQNVTARNNRMGVYIHGTNDGAVSTKVEGSITTSNSQHGIAVYDDTNATFEADLGGGSMGSAGNNVLAGNTLEDLAVEYDGRALSAQNNWWGQASGADTDTPDVGVRPQIYYGAPINDGLVGHWTFDTEWTNNTTAFDRSGLSNDGVISGAAQIDITSDNLRQASLFPDDGRYLDVGNLSGSSIFESAFTILGWVNSDDLTGPNSNIRDYIGNESFVTIDDGFVIRQSADSIRFQANGIGDSASLNTVVIDSNISIDTWYNYGVVITAVDITTYSQGIFANSSLLKGPLDFSATGNLFRVGRTDVPSRDLSGLSDDVRIYNRALSAGEVAELNRMDASSIVNTGGFLTAAP